MPFKRGARHKYKNNVIISKLNDRGWNALNVHRLLLCSRGKGYFYLNNPSELKLWQVKAVCIELGMSLGSVLNSLFSTPKESLNWLDDGFNPLEEIERIKGLKRGE